MFLYTQRLILRPWAESDAEMLYIYASDPEIGPLCGWPPHTGVDNSRDIIKGVLSEPEQYAAVTRGDGRLAGSVCIKFPSDSLPHIKQGQGELGCWLGRPFWGRGLIPEALRSLAGHAFEDLGLTGLWYGHINGNNNSKRVAEKLGFTYSHTGENIPFPLMGTSQTIRYYFLSSEGWADKID